MDEPDAVLVDAVRSGEVARFSEIVARYEARGITVLRTDDHGAITVRLTPEGVRVWTMLPGAPESETGPE